MADGKVAKQVCLPLRHLLSWRVQNPADRGYIADGRLRDGRIIELWARKAMDVLHPDRCDTTGVAEWLVDGARSAPEAGHVLAELCHRLLACGVPVWRAAVLVRTLHPDVVGRRFL